PRIVEVEPAAEGADAELLEPLAHRFLVVDDEAEVARLVGRLRASPRQRDELVAHVDEGHPAGASAQLERAEDRLPERERLVDVSDLEREVIDSDQLRHPAQRTPAALGP